MHERRADQERMDEEREERRPGDRERTERERADHEGTDYERVERAIRFLDEHRSRQPDLQDVADHVGLSRFHFHRLFRRWAGTTPKRFLQHLTVEHARGLLAESKPVLEAAFASGLSGGGRLHDHFVQVEAVTPGEVGSGGRGLRIRAGIHPSPFGDAFLATTDRGICFLAFLPEESSPDREAVRARAQRDLEMLWPSAEIVADAAATATLAGAAFGPWTEPRGGGMAEEPPLPVHLKGTNFQLQVWRGLLRIPPGRVASYGTLAGLLERPGGARAVGGAVGANPVALLIPCHRVIRSEGSLGGYRWGSPRKRAMLAHEWGNGRSGGH